MKKNFLKLFFIIFFIVSFSSFETVNASDKEKLSSRPYPIVGTGTVDFYSDKAKIDKPKKGEKFYGQDAHYPNNPPSYTDNKDGTITDNVTGLMWQKDMGKKMTYSEALDYCEKANLAGHTDWRIPTIKELYSLIDYTGQSGGQSGKTVAKKLYIDTNYFIQPLGDTKAGEREIDAQTWSSTRYVGRVMNNDHALFGVNFIDGRIKGYPILRRGQGNKMYFRLVRGNEDYGKNRFVDNGNGTISDLATGLMWQKADSKKSMDWGNALAYAENLKLANYEDWRLPNAKELQSIVDYTRSLQTTDSPAIDPLFETSKISLVNKENQYPYFWTSTSHLDGRNIYEFAVYIAFGNAYGIMPESPSHVHGGEMQRGGQGGQGGGRPPQNRQGGGGQSGQGNRPPQSELSGQGGQGRQGGAPEDNLQSQKITDSSKLLDVHGAGAQRSDPKSGNSANYPDAFGPQGDIRLVYNYVRAVRNIN